MQRNAAVATTDPQQVVTEKALTWPERAKAVQITSSETYTQSAELLLAIRALRNEVNQAFDPIIADAHKAHKTACDQKRRAETPLLEAETIIKRGLVAYTTEQDRKRRAEESRLREIQRQEEETRRLNEAAALETEANATGDLALKEQAEALIEAPIPVMPVETETKAPPKVDGISYRDVYRGDVVDLDALVLAAMADKTGQLRGYLKIEPNQSAIDAMARSLREKLAIPGVRLVVDKIPVTRTR